MTFRYRYRTLGQGPEVSIITSSHVQFDAVEADRACGSETRFILYMLPGELLSRSVTSKDTHSPKGDLLVTYTNVEAVSHDHVKRTLASTILLGFHPPSFTFGTDLILPVEANELLRAKLAEIDLTQGLKDANGKQDVPYVQIIRTLELLIPTEQKRDVSFHIPEVREGSLFHNSTENIVCGIVL